MIAILQFQVLVSFRWIPSALWWELFFQTWLKGVGGLLTMSNFCSFWIGLFHRKWGLRNPTGQFDLNREDANLTSPQDQADARLSDITGSPSLVRIPVSKSRKGALQLCLRAKSVSKVSGNEGRRALDTGSNRSGKQKSFFNMGFGGTSSDVVQEAETIFQLAIPLTLEANEGMNLSFKTENGVLVTEKHTELDSQESKSEAFSANDPEISKNADCLLVTNSGLLENQDAHGDLISEFPSIAPKDGTTDNLALSTMNSGFPQYHNADSLERCSLDDTHFYLPVLEGFIMQIDDGEPSISFDKQDQLKSVIKNASILEELCKSACIQNPVPTGLLEGMDGKNKLPTSDAVKQINDNYGCLREERKQMRLDHRAADRAEFIQKMEKEKALEQLRTLVPQARLVPKFDELPIRLSPVSRVWEILDTELPCISEGNENAEERPKGNVPEVWTSSFKRKLKKKLENPESSKRNNKEKQTLAVGASGVNTESIYNWSNKAKLTGKTSLRGGPTLSEVEPKHNNTVTSITSFIPLVQQKQAAAALPVKRDIKVKALKAAEAAKRLAEKKEYERKIKKEALKIEKARKEKENLRQLELQKKKKEEEHKKKEADMTAKKRQREEREKKEKDRKQMCLEEERKKHREYNQKFGAEKQEKERKLRTTNESGHEMKDSKDERGKHKMDKEKRRCSWFFRCCNFSHSSVN